MIMPEISAVLLPLPLLPEISSYARAHICPKKRKREAHAREEKTGNRELATTN